MLYPSSTPIDEDSSSTDSPNRRNTLADLIKWIDTKPHFPQTDTSIAPYLYKPDWTSDNLKTALRYAIECVRLQRENYLTAIRDAKKHFDDDAKTGFSDILDFNFHFERANPKIRDTVLNENQLLQMSQEVRSTGNSISSSSSSGGGGGGSREGGQSLIESCGGFRRAIVMCMEGRWMIHDFHEELKDQVKDVESRIRSMKLSEDRFPTCLPTVGRQVGDADELLSAEEKKNMPTSLPRPR